LGTKGQHATSRPPKPLPPVLNGKLFIYKEKGRPTNVQTPDGFFLCLPFCFILFCCQSRPGTKHISMSNCASVTYCRLTKSVNTAKRM